MIEAILLIGSGIIAGCGIGYSLSRIDAVQVAAVNWQLLQDICAFETSVTMDEPGNIYLPRHGYFTAATDQIALAQALAVLQRG